MCARAMNMNPRLEKEFRSLAVRTTVVLTGTLYPGNIGSAARSMHTFGFTNLSLVSPQCEIEYEARKLAVNSLDVLESAVIYDNLESALEGKDIVIGTTRRMGRKRGSYYTPPSMAEAVAALDPTKKIAIVFGPEDTGLCNDHLVLCPWLVTIPTFSEFDSLNLSHAVTVILYEITKYYTDVDTGAPEDAKRLEGLMVHIEQLLRESGFLPAEGDPRRALLTLRRMIKRGKWSRSESDLFHSVLKDIEKLEKQDI